MALLNKQHDEEKVEDPSPATPDAGAQGSGRESVLSGLRAKRREAERVKAGDELLGRPIEALGDDMIAYYKYVPMERSQKQAARLKNLPEQVQDYYAACDVLLMANVNLKLRVNGELVNMSGNEEAMTFNDVAALCDAFDIPNPDGKMTARGILLELFLSEYGVIAEAQRVSQWMTNLKKGVDEHFLA